MLIRAAFLDDIPRLIPLLNDLDHMHHAWDPEIFVPLAGWRTTEQVAELLGDPKGEGNWEIADGKGQGGSREKWVRRGAVEGDAGK